MNRYVLYSIVSLCCFFVACTSENEKESLLSQEKNIDAYITAQLNKTDSTKALSVVYNDESYRLVYQEGTGTTVKAGDNVEFEYRASVFANGRGATFDANVDVNGFNRTNSDSLYTHGDLGKGIAGKGFYIPGLDKGLIGMKEGEYSQILFSAAQGYGNKSVGIVPPLSPLIFDIYLVKVKSN